MNSQRARRLKFATPQGWITIALLIIAAFCFGYSIEEGNYRQLSELVPQALSFPLGWAFAWVAADLTVIRNPKNVCLFVALVTLGTHLNLRAWVAIVFWFRKHRDEVRPPEVREAEFQKLLAEHRKQNG
ncbi:MAG: hypothetical protein RLY20_1057 [Verrucomicrobiota bacterium]|jgi:hypothetical protein